MKETGEASGKGNHGRSYRAAGFEPVGLKAGQGFREAVNAAVRRMEAQGRLPKASRSIGIRATQGARK